MLRFAKDYTNFATTVAKLPREYIILLKRSAPMLTSYYNKTINSISALPKFQKMTQQPSTESSFSEPARAANTHQYSLQEYLSLGYVYLIILGIISDVIYFNFFGVNILKYAAISDILISPISTLVKDIRVLITVVVFIGLAYLFMFKAMPNFHLKNKHKGWYRKIQNVEKMDKYYSDIGSNNNKKAEFLLFFLFSMFLGMGIGSGAATKNRIEKGELKLDHTIIFSDNISKQVKMIGQNSGYLFYLTEGQKQVSITPMGQVKEIQKI